MKKIHWAEKYQGQIERDGAQRRGCDQGVAFSDTVNTLFLTFR